MGLDTLQDQPLKEGLAEPCPGCLLVDDDRPQLAVVPHQHSLLGAQDQGNERLRFSCLCGLVHQQLQVQQPKLYSRDNVIGCDRSYFVLSWIPVSKAVWQTRMHEHA